MDFDYPLETIKGRKTHIDLHPVESDELAGDSAGRDRGGKLGGVQRDDYLFKLIVTHEVRSKLLCLRGLGYLFEMIAWSAI